MIGVQPNSSNDQSECVNFYLDILPSDGTLCIFIAGQKRYIWVNTPEELTCEVNKLTSRTDVYFATASYKKAGSQYTGRTQKDVYMLKCLRLDLDAGPTKLKKHGPEKVYDHGQLALEGLQQFTASTGLKFSYLVRSGEGLHVYYALDAAITPDAWVPLANALQNFCLRYGLKVDPSVTTDSARVLRPIGTLHPCGRVVKILKSTGVKYMLEQFAGIIGPLQTQTEFIQTQVDAGTEGADFELIKAGCSVINWAVNPHNQNYVEEPLWRGVLGIVKFCVGANELAHEVSKFHEKYDLVLTVQKMAGWKTPPTTCSEFAKYKPELCSACKHVERAA